MYEKVKHLPAWFPGAWFIRKARGTFITYNDHDSGLIPDKDTKPILNRMEVAPFEEVRREMVRFS